MLVHIQIMLYDRDIGVCRIAVLKVFYAGLRENEDKIEVM